MIRLVPNADGKITDTLRRREPILERYGVGCVRVGEEGRKIYDGPMVPGPWAYAYRLCTVVACGGEGSRKESEDGLAAKTEHLFSHGDLIEVDGVTYKTVRANNDNTHLEAV